LKSRQQLTKSGKLARRFGISLNFHHGASPMSETLEKAIRDYIKTVNETPKTLPVDQVCRRHPRFNQALLPLHHESR
jgi:hypothetical protein